MTMASNDNSHDDHNNDHRPVSNVLALSFAIVSVSTITTTMILLTHAVPTTMVTHDA